MAKKTKIFGFRDAYEFLNISAPYFCKLLKRYNVPYQKAAKGRVFFLEDLEELQSARTTKQSPNFEPIKNRPKLFGQNSASKFIGVSQGRFQILIKNYKIPYTQLSNGRIFFESDLNDFMNSDKRKAKLKHRRTEP